MKVILILGFPTQTPMSGKILVLEFSTKMFLPVRLQDSLSVIFLKKIEGSSCGFLVDKHQSSLQVGTIAYGGFGQA